MYTTYEEYLATPQSLTFGKMQELHALILGEISADADAQEIYDELIETATSYADFRARWLLMDKAKKMDVDSSRTAYHNSLIVKFNMLSRYFKMNGHKATWRDVLGYEEDDRYNRKTIGDFACYLVFINSINAR